MPSRRVLNVMVTPGEPMDVFDLESSKMEWHFGMIHLLLVCRTVQVPGRRSGRKLRGDLRNNPNEK